VSQSHRWGCQCKCTFYVNTCILTFSNNASLPSQAKASCGGMIGGKKAMPAFVKKIVASRLRAPFHGMKGAGINYNKALGRGINYNKALSGGKKHKGK
jgi:hypothetical protein